MLALTSYYSPIKATNWCELITQYGESGEFEKMDSIFTLSTQTVNYKNDPINAVKVHTLYAQFLNQKGEYNKALNLFTEIKNQIANIKRQYHHLSFEEQKVINESESIVTYERVFSLWSENQLHEAQNAIEEAVDFFIQKQDSSMLAESYNLAGVIYKRLFMYDKAVLSYKEALNITEKQQNYGLSQILANNISALYNELNKNQQAISLSRKALSYPETDTLSISVKIKRISLLCTHGALLGNGKYIENALDTIKLAVNTLQDNMPDGLKLLTYFNYAKILHSAGKTQTAIQYYQKALKYRDTTTHEGNKANLDYLYGYTLFHNTDSLEQAYKYAKRAVDSLRKFPSIILSKSLLLLAEIEAKRNNLSNSYQLVLEAYDVEEQIQADNFQKRLSGFEAELKTKEKDLQIVKLNSKREEDKIAYQTRIYIVSGVLAFTILLIITLTIYIRKRKVSFTLKQMQLEKEIKEKELLNQTLIEDMDRKMREQYLNGLEDSNNRISKELHDGICNELLSIEMNMKQNSSILLEQAIAQVREDVRRLSHQLATPTFNHINLYQMLTVYIDKLRAIKEPSIQPYIEEKISQVIVSPEKQIEIYRIIQETVSNAIKHAHAKNIYLTISLIDKHMDILIEDDGIGFDFSRINVNTDEGLGLKTIKERSTNLNGECNIESDKGKGTIVHVWFPLT